MNLVGLTIIVTYLPVLIFFAFTPYLTRKTEQFGVGIPETVYDHPEVGQLRKRYRNQNLLSGSLFAVLFILGNVWATSMTVTFLLPIGLIAQIVLGFSFYFQGHQKMRQLKSQHQWGQGQTAVVVVETGFRKGKVTVSPWWFLAYVAIIILTWLLGYGFFDRIPTRVPLHYNYLGQVDRWGIKSWKLICLAPVMQLFISGLMVLVYWIIGQSKQQVDSENPEQSVVQNQVFRFRWSAFIVFAGMALLLVFAWMQATILGLVQTGWMIMGVPLLVTGLIVVAALVLSVTTGQGGSRLRTAHSKTGKLINRDEDRFWKLGMFYYNPDDPAVFVEKRFGIGWTNNFAQPLSWVLLIGAVLVLPLVIIAVSQLLTR